MGPLKMPTTGSVYVDACVLIYAVEKVPPYCTLLQPLWDAARLGHCLICTSELTLAEVLVKPLREGDALMRDLFRETILASEGTDPIPVTRSVLEKAAEIRAIAGLRTPDAIHVASAQSAGCSCLVTNDPVFSRVLVLDDLLSP